MGADLDGFVDVDVMRTSAGVWRERGDALKQAFAVPDLREANEEERALWMSMQQQKADEEKGQSKERIESALERVEKEVNGIKSYKKGGERTPKEMLDEAQEMLAQMKAREELSEEEGVFVKEMEAKVGRFVREVRALRIEVRMM